MSRLFRFVCVAIAHVVLFTASAKVAHAQDDKVYTLGELSDKPKLSSPTNAARLIQESYPRDLKERGVGGMVEVSFIVDKNGKVDPTSVEITDATQTALGEAAKKLVPKLEFQPGKVNGSAVKSKVSLPIIYKAT